MPVKVRCPSCEKVLTAPDGARGKAIKCPGCETKIRVPAGDAEASGAAKRSGAQGPAKKATKSAAGSGAADGIDFLTKMDVSQAEDRSTRVCRKCGADVDEEDLECPECGVNIETGQLSAAKKLKASRKGPDPAEFYTEAWTSSWAFLLANKRAALISGVLGIVCHLMMIVCVCVGLWCSTPPPRVFWFFSAIMFFVTVPGWYWYLATETIRESLKKKKVLKNVRADIFLCMALGVQAVAWLTVFFLPSHLIVLLGVWLGGFTGALASAGVCTLLFVPMIPLSMIHMSMPVTWKGWSSPHMFMVLVKNAGPSYYWWLVTYCALIGAQIVAGLIIWLILKYGLTIAFAMKINIVQNMQFMGAARDDIGQVLLWSTFGGIVCLFMLWQTIYAAALIFSMRAMGMLAYYFRDNLDLITEVKEKEYVARKVGEDGRVIPQQTNNAKKASAGVGGVFALYLVVNLISWAVGGPILVPRWLAVILNAIPADGPAPQQADPAAADPAAGGPAAAPQPAALPASLPQPGAAPAATATPATPPPDPGASAPPPTPGAATPPPDPGAAAPPPAPGAAAPPPDPGAAAAPPPP